MEDRDHERRLLVPVDDPADDVRGPVPVEGRAQHLDLEVRLLLGPLPAEVREQALHHAVDVAVEVGVRTRPTEVAEDGGEGRAQSRLLRVVAAVGRRARLDVLRRDRRADEDELVPGVGAVEHAPHDGVEEGLGELRALVVDEPADVVELGFGPCLPVDRLRCELVPQARHGLLDAVVVEADPLAHRVLDPGPVARVEPVLGRGARPAEEAVVAIEALDERLGDVPRDGGSCRGPEPSHRDDPRRRRHGFGTDTCAFHC